MTAAKYRKVELDIGHLEQIVERAALSDADRADLSAAIDTLAFVTRELENRRASVARLRKMLFGASTEKSSKLLADIDHDDNARSADDCPSGDCHVPDGTSVEPTSESASDQPKPKRKGHGRRSAASYRGGEKVTVVHDALKAQDPCPACEKGKLYELQVPTVLVRVTGRAPLGAIIYECLKLRCNLCGEVYVPKAPAEAGAQKYDDSAAAMIAVLKYGSGLPFHRLARLQAGLGIPLPVGTQWQIVEQAARTIAPAHDELVRQAAQGEVLYNDDTTAKILAVMAARAKGEPTGDDTDPDRTGTFTTGIVATNQGIRIALFFTGTSHAGENLAQLLKRRASDLGPPIQMCDALSRNYAGHLDTILANCVAHGRRKFVDVLTDFPDQCRHVIETLRDVYHNDSIAAARGMSPDERLAWHRKTSGPLMKDLRKWFDDQLKDKKVEENSGLGEAIAYMIKHWHKLTLFLRVPGAPMDNNLCERILKKPILHRKAALFFKTRNGASVGDVFMSLIHTAELCRADPFDYLVALLRHADQVRIAPAQWMPWNYSDARDRLAAAA
jgi:transposase